MKFLEYIIILYKIENSNQLSGKINLIWNLKN